MKKKITVILLSAVMLISFALSSAAYTGEHFTVDVPDGYNDVSTDEMNMWQLSGGSSFIVLENLNSRKFNMYNASDSDAEEMASVFKSELENGLKNAYGDEYDISIRILDYSVGSLGIYPAITVNLTAEFKQGEELLFREYQRNIVLSSKAHIFSLTYTSVNSDSLTDEENAFINSFTITEDVYTSASGISKGRFIGGILAGGLTGAAALLCFYFIGRKKKKTAVNSDDMNGYYNLNTSSGSGSNQDSRQ